MKRHFLWIPSALIAASLVFVACGDDDDATDDLDGANGEPTESMDSGNGDDMETPANGDDMETPSNGDDMETPSNGDDMETPSDGANGDDMGGSTVTLEGVNDSGMSGEATLAESGDSVDVTVMVDDSMATGTAAVHTGTCDDFDESSVADIGDLEAGMATGTVDVAMADMTAEDHVIVVMDDSDEAVLCGEISG